MRSPYARVPLAPRADPSSQEGSTELGAGTAGFPSQLWEHVPSPQPAGESPCVPVARGQRAEQKPPTQPAGSRQELHKPHGARGDRQFISSPTHCCKGPCPCGTGAEPGLAPVKVAPELVQKEAGPVLEKCCLGDFSGLDGGWGCPSPFLILGRSHPETRGCVPITGAAGACGCPVP